MAVIWGLDLREMQWGKFKYQYMFKNRDYHLRRTKFIVYQLAMICFVVSESIGTAALSGTTALLAQQFDQKPCTDSFPDYVKQQSQIEKLHSSARVHNDAFVGAASFNIFCGVAIATIFGAAFFFDLFWPERYEPKNIRWAWKLSAVFVTVCGLASALALTVIVARNQATITANDADQLAIAEGAINPPLVYRHNGRAIAAVVFVWPGWIATLARYVQWKMRLVCIG